VKINCIADKKYKTLKETVPSIIVYMFCTTQKNNRLGLLYVGSGDRKGMLI